jgi:hypothetical protein
VGLPSHLVGHDEAHLEISAQQPKHEQTAQLEMFVAR